MILTLGLSIGANASIFSALNAYLLKPMPVRNADRLAAVATIERSSGLISSVSYPMYRAASQLTNVYEDVVTWMGAEVALRYDRESVRGFMLAGSDNYFSALGVGAAMGRVYSADEARSRVPVMVLTDRYWERTFDRDRTVIGRTVFVNEIPFTVICVLSPEFKGTQPLIIPDAIVPIESMLSVDAALSRQYPEAFADARFVTEREIRTRPEYAVSRLTPWIAGVFFGMVGLALLVACANVANLLLVRATVRRSEIAIRSAIGATPVRVIRLLLTESFVLSAVSLVVAYALARLCIGWLNTLPLAIDLPISFGWALDGRVFAYAAAVSLLAGVVSGLAPALMGARAPVSEVLRDGGRTGSAGRGRTRLRSALVVAQVAVSFLLLVCGGLFIQSARSAAQLDLGFSRDRLLLAQVDLTLHRIDERDARQLQDRVLESIAALPGVERVALSTFRPMSGNFDTHIVHISGRPPQAPDGMMSVGAADVTPGLVATLGLRLRQGRDFTAQDDTASPPVVLVNRAMADALWPQQDPIGQHVRLTNDGVPAEVVGLVDNATTVLLGELPRPMLFAPLRQHPSRRTFIMTKGRGPDPSALTAGIHPCRRRVGEPERPRLRRAPHVGPPRPGDRAILREHRGHAGDRHRRVRAVADDRWLVRGAVLFGGTACQGVRDPHGAWGTVGRHDPLGIAAECAAGRDRAAARGRAVAGADPRLAQRVDRGVAHRCPDLRRGRGDRRRTRDALLLPAGVAGIARRAGDGGARGLVDC